MISLTAKTHVNHIRQQGYAVIKQAVDPAVVRNLLEFANTFQYTEDEQANLLRNQQRLNSFDRTIYKRQDALRLFIRGTPGEVLKELLNEKFYAAIPPDQPNYILRAMHLRSSLEALPYHIDSFIPYSGNYTSVGQAILFLNDSKVDNGCYTGRAKIPSNRGICAARRECGGNSFRGRSRGYCDLGQQDFACNSGKQREKRPVGAHCHVLPLVYKTRV
jgi:hypothetical protein